MTTMLASPVSPARKAAYRELGTKGRRGRQEKAWSSRTRMKTAASETAGGRKMVRSESSLPSVPRTEEKRVTNGQTYVLHAAAEGGEVMHRAFTPVEKFLEALGQMEFLVWRDGDGAADGVNDHASVGDALGWSCRFSSLSPEPRSSARRCHPSCDRREARAERLQTGQPPMRPAHGPCGGVLVTKIVSSTQSAVWRAVS